MLSDEGSRFYSEGLKLGSTSLGVFATAADPPYPLYVMNLSSRKWEKVGEKVGWEGSPTVLA